MHYRPGDEELARLLLGDMGGVLVDNGPRPGADGFCTVVFDPDSAFADNLLFLARVHDAQLALEDALVDQLGLGRQDQHPALTDFLAYRHERAELVAHLGIRYATFEQLEEVVAALERDSAPGGPLHGRVELFKRVPPRGFSRAVDERVAASSVLGGTELEGPAKHWVQCRIVTDVLGFGLIPLGSEFELDYVFPDWFDGPASFAPPKRSAAS